MGNEVMFKAVIDLAMVALRGIMLANGGAAIAILAFLGHVWTEPTRAQKLVGAGLADALSTFAWGVGASIVAAALGYLCQLCFADLMKRAYDGWGITGIVLRIIAIGVAVVGIVCFFVGISQSIAAFRTGAAA